MLCRCLREQHAWPKGKNGREYVGYVIPIGYPNTSATCGLCDDPAVVWLDEAEINSYEQGNRIFSGNTNVIRIKVDDNGITRRNNKKMY